ncbi:MAG: hypothetical protein CL670_08085 [Balneola sp.]|jgi:hypothetical protein|nr:hypothetical protein [Balneola sp.]MBE79096.1 hypothetical protein [Balneola sp.]|tara:strand:+ start:475 stop:1023 length:549 start_codon:yes stop_codon:yes gene_type:complete
MKKLIQLSFLLVLATFFVAETAVAQDRSNSSARPSPNASVSQTIGTTEVTVTYGRPGLKGRELETLAPVGKVWRTGANESAAIAFSDDVMVGGEEVEAGTYSLYSLPNGDEWTIILNNKLSWGTQYDMGEDYVRVPAAAVNNGATMMERFTIYFDTLTDTKAHLNLHWGTTKVAVPITTGSM